MMWLISVQIETGEWMPRFCSFYREIAEQLAEAIHEQQDTETKMDLVKYDPTKFYRSMI